MFTLFAHLPVELVKVCSDDGNWQRQDDQSNKHADRCDEVTSHCDWRVVAVADGSHGHDAPAQKNISGQHTHSHTYTHTHPHTQKERETQAHAYT